MPDLTMGANAPIIEDSSDLVMEWPASAGSLDCSAFLLSSSGKVRSDADMIFYNQMADADGSVRLVSPDGGAYARFSFDLHRVPSDVERIVVCVVVDRDGRTMEGFIGFEASFGSGSSAIRFRPDLRDAKEAALRVVEIYRRGGGWKLRADGQGYNAGLGPLAESFGVDVEGSEPAATATAVETPLPRPSGDGLRERSAAAFVDEEPPIVFDVQPVDIVAAARGVQRPVDASVLQHRGMRRLTLSDGTAENALRASLSWSSRQGGAEGRARPLRLRLGTFYDTRAGMRGVLQEPDALEGPPGDDLLKLIPRDGSDTDRQIVTVAAGRMTEIRMLHLYAVLDGSSTWRSSHVELLVTVPGNPPVVMEVPKQDDGCSCILIATVEIEGNGAMLQHLGRPAADQHALDAVMGWNLRWRHPDRL